MESHTAAAAGAESIKRRVDNRWTKQEDEILFERVTASGPLIFWRKVAEALPGRNNKACRKRWIHSLDPNLRKGRWSPAEDAALTAAVKVHGDQWYQVARTLNNGRTDDQCAKRWREALDPSIRKHCWTAEEDRLLMDAFAKCGRKWTEISRVLNGRPSVQCRNRFMSLQKQDTTFDAALATSPVSDFSSTLDLKYYDSCSIASSRRSSLSSDSSIPSPITTYPSSDHSPSHPTKNWQTTTRATELFHPHISYQDGSCHNSWNSSYQHENDRYSIVENAEFAGIGLRGSYRASHSGGSVMNDTSVSTSSVVGFGGTSPSSGPQYYSLPYNTPVFMTWPDPNCAYLDQSLTEIWRHRTWEHVSSSPAFGNNNNSDVQVGAVERFTLGS